jgi:hypothetical protein
LVYPYKKKLLDVSRVLREHFFETNNLEILEKHQNKMRTLDRISLKDWDLLSEVESARLYGGVDPPTSDSKSVAVDSIKTSASASTSKPLVLNLSTSSNYNNITKTTSASIGVGLSKSGSFSASISVTYTNGPAGSGFSYGIGGSISIPVKK